MLISTYSKGRCPTPDKQRYSSEDEAWCAADYIFDSQEVSLEPYACACGLWHLATPIPLRGLQRVSPPPKGGTRQGQRRAWLQKGALSGKQDRRPPHPGLDTLTTDAVHSRNTPSKEPQCSPVSPPDTSPPETESRCKHSTEHTPEQ